MENTLCINPLDHALNSVNRTRSMDGKSLLEVSLAGGESRDEANELRLPGMTL